MQLLGTIPAFFVPLSISSMLSLLFSNIRLTVEAGSLQAVMILNWNQASSFFFQDTGKHPSKPKQSRGLWVTFGHMSPLKSLHMGSEVCGSAKLIGWFNRLVAKVCLFTLKTLVNPRQEFGISLQIFSFIIVSFFLLLLLYMGLIVQVLLLC